MGQISEKRQKQIKIHKLAINLSYCITNPNNEPLDVCEDKFLEILEDAKNNKPEIFHLSLNYQNSWLLQIACFHKKKFYIQELIKNNISIPNNQEEIVKNYNGNEKALFIEHLRFAEIWKQEYILERDTPQAQPSKKSLKF